MNPLNVLKPLIYRNAVGFHGTAVDQRATTGTWETFSDERQTFWDNDLSRPINEAFSNVLGRGPHTYRRGVYVIDPIPRLGFKQVDDGYRRHRSAEAELYVDDGIHILTEKYASDREDLDKRVTDDGNVLQFPGRVVGELGKNEFLGRVATVLHVYSSHGYSMPTAEIHTTLPELAGISSEQIERVIQRLYEMRLIRPVGGMTTTGVGFNTELINKLPEIHNAVTDLHRYYSGVRKRVMDSFKPSTESQQAESQR